MAKLTVTKASKLPDGPFLVLYCAVTTTTNNPSVITCKLSGDDKVTAALVDGVPIKGA